MEASQAPYRVLIVDDVPAVREALRWALEDEPDLAVVGEASSGAEALACVGELTPDVVILDIELPGLDGYAVAQQLKQASHPPVVVFLSVHGDSVSRRRGREAGGDGFAEKGTGWIALISQVRRSLGSRPDGAGAYSGGS
ncbi:MAG TPA: response regulator transcription factor [Ardenticatenaceae bacterium]|nr:response regulator transcription factor [Ardenticatenaceae bacterium]